MFVTTTFGRLLVERLPEGVCLVTSDDVPGLVAQGATFWKRSTSLPT
jgi:hypothetical protein